MALKIKGTAIEEGVSRHQIRYTKEELEKSHHSLKGRPMLKDHESKVDNIVGKVLESTGVFEDGKYKIKFESVVSDARVEALINSGLLETVSVGATAARIVKENDDDEVMLAEGLEYLELSFTPTPGIAGATFKPAQNSIKSEENKIDEVKKEEKKKEEAEEETSEMLKAELSRIQEEISRLKIEKAKAELESLKEKKKNNISETKGVVTPARVTNDKYVIFKENNETHIMARTDDKGKIIY